MKKILLSAYLCLVLLLAWAQEPGLRASAFLSPSPTPCPQTGILRSAKVQQVMVVFYCGVSAAQQDLIIKYLGPALRAMPPGLLPGARVIAFTDLDEGVTAEYDLLKGEGYSPSLESLRSAWLDNEFLGQAFKGAAFLYVGEDAWSRDPAAVAPLTVLHEMHHILQYQLLDSSHYVPAWLLEGGADAFAALEMANLGLPAPSRSASSHACEFSLTELDSAREDVPRACFYLEGARAVRLLLDEYGSQPYYRLFRSIGTNSTFAGAFDRAYGFPLSDFYRCFDADQGSGHAWRPKLPAPSLASPP